LVPDTAEILGDAIREKKLSLVRNWCKVLIKAFNCLSLQPGLAQGVDPTFEVGRVLISISAHPADPL